MPNEIIGTTFIDDDAIICGSKNGSLKMIHEDKGILKD